jgi:uncharacterized protein YbbC (DUF1343 family)
MAAMANRRVNFENFLFDFKVIFLAMYRSRFKWAIRLVTAILVALLGNSFAPSEQASLRTGADQPERYLPLLAHKRVALVANQTTVLLPSGQHLVDFLLEKKVNLVKVFAPEHGFRGNHAAGSPVGHEVDSKTGLPVVSLYGNNRKPNPAQMQDIDIVIFDIQYVGVRFYTYISTMHLVMESAAENGVDVLVLDRPNPHGNGIDGPVLKKGFESFVGMHQVPVIHGMTIGEYAHMINDEGWLKNSVRCSLQIVPVEGWKRIQGYSLPIAPSPNLPNDLSITLYPSICFFEGTNISIGRGTSKPFQVYGHPDLKGPYTFTPKHLPGIAEHPPHENTLCNGHDMAAAPWKDQPFLHTLNLEPLLLAYKELNAGSTFFTSFFDKLAGNDVLRQQIIKGMTANEIRETWKSDLASFRAMRGRYLLYE